MKLTLGSLKCSFLNLIRTFSDRLDPGPTHAVIKQSGDSMPVAQVER